MFFGVSRKTEDNIFSMKFLRRGETLLTKKRGLWRRTQSRANYSLLDSLLTGKNTGNIALLTAPVPRQNSIGLWNQQNSSLISTPTLR